MTNHHPANSKMSSLVADYGSGSDSDTSSASGVDYSVVSVAENDSLFRVLLLYLQPNVITFL